MKERNSMEREFEVLNLAALPGSQQPLREWEVKPGGQAVSDSFDIHYRWVCRLQVQEKVGSNWKDKEPATGVLIGPRHVLTTAHLLDPYWVCLPVLSAPSC